jgi:pimeloyl-ACP methyl ester carboxylesterase
MSSGHEIQRGGFTDVDGPVHFREWEGHDTLTFVLIHGLGGSHLNWLAVAPRMAERGRVVALDLPGFGLSPLAGRSAGLDANRRLVARFVRSETEGPVVLVGNSMGGALAILAAAADPDAYEGLALANAALPWTSDHWPSALQLAAFTIYCVPGAGRAFSRLRVRGFTPERMVDMSFRFLTVDPDSIDARTRAEHARMAELRQRDPESVDAFLQAARSLVAAAARKRSVARDLDGVSTPTLLMHGARDRAVPHAWAEAAVRGRPSWELHTFPDAGHLVMMEDPDGFVSTMWEWLDRNAIGHAGARIEAGRGNGRS